MVASNVLGEKIFDVNKDAYRSIIGFSEGSQVVSETVAINQNLYDNIVFVNGATTYNSDSDSSAIRNGNYEGFKNVPVYYIISSDGWNTLSVINSIDELLRNGVTPNNITLISNDN